MLKPQYYDQETFIQNMAIEPVWKKNIKGKDVTVLVTDVGIFQHDDLCNVDRSKSLDTQFYDKKMYETGNGFSSHGTSVAGLVGATGEKYFIGVAPSSNLIDLNYTEVNEDQMCNFWLKNKNCADIFNNSWGYLPVNYAPKKLVRTFKKLAEEGRKGKGNIILFAAGNNDTSKNYDPDYFWEQYFTFDTSMNYFLNSRYTISVGATDNDVKASFSTRGSGLLCCASLPGTNTNTNTGYIGHHDHDYHVHDESTSDAITPLGTFRSLPGSDIKYNSILLAAAGSKFGYLPVTNSHTGTSFACAIVSGICALLLEYRCDLTWRDVKELISLSCWQLGVNGVRMNGAKRLISELTGFGVLDASKLIKNACKWKLLPKEEVVEIVIPIPPNVQMLNLQQDRDDIDPNKNIKLKIYVPNDITIETLQLCVDINAFKDKTINCCLDNFIKFLNGDINAMEPEFAYVYSIQITAFKTSDIRITVMSPVGTTVTMAFGNFFENINGTIIPIENAFSQYQIDHDVEKFSSKLKDFFDGFIPYYASFEAYASTWLKHLILSELFRGEQTKGYWCVTFNDVMFDFIKTISGNELPATFLTGAKLIFAGHDKECCGKCEC